MHEAEQLELGAMVVDSAAVAEREAAMLDRLAWRFPHLPVMLVENSIAHDGTVSPLRRMTEVRANSSTPHLCHRLDTLLGDAIARSAVGRTDAIVDGIVPPLDWLVADFLLEAARTPRTVGTVTQLARRIGVSVRTLEQHLSVTGLPPAHVLFRTILVLRAAILLQDPRCTLRRVTALLPFPDPPAVSVCFRRYVRMGASEARGAAVLDDLWQRFAALIDGCSLRVPLDAAERERLRAAAKAQQLDEREWARRAILRWLERIEEERSGAFTQRIAHSAIDRRA
ncbi:MAG TPA: hypothetical protein VJ596_04590 [Gemmatimonadaceae bacterium]|nr:hypothetical protein [Gemmatimonadaceae bacterium]